MAENKTNTLVIILMSINILLMVSIIGLYLKVNQFQQQILTIFKPNQVLEQPEGLEIGTFAPVFSLQGTDGQFISNRVYLGKNLLLVFFSPECPKCREILPAIKMISETDKNLEVLMISNADIESNRQLTIKENLTFPVLLWIDSVVEQYKVSNTPLFYVIDSSGRISNYGFANTLDDLKTLVAKQE
ncbi:MAG: TlpA disulfide reductase family protein [Anaerolineaceae bacterium]|nr:TlpA disulfide reductase family protein [Anaerolineaceae bacterium]